MFLLSEFPHVFQQRTLFSPNLFSVGSHSAVMQTSKADGSVGVGNFVEKWAARLFPGQYFGHRLKILVFMHLDTTVSQELCLGLNT